VSPDSQTFLFFHQTMFHISWRFLSCYTWHHFWLANADSVATPVMLLFSYHVAILGGLAALTIALCPSVCQSVRSVPPVLKQESHRNL